MDWSQLVPTPVIVVEKLVQFTRPVLYRGGAMNCPNLRSQDQRRRSAICRNAFCVQSRARNEDAAGQRSKMRFQMAP